jgi:signal transduction histidine kinase
MVPDTQIHQIAEMNPAGSRHRLAPTLKRFNVLSRLIPANAGSRKTLNLMLLVVVLPTLLLGVALVNFLTSRPSSAADATLVNTQQLDLALADILKHQAQALAAIAADPALLNGVFTDEDIADATVSKTGGEFVNRRLDQLLQVNSRFESLALVNNEGSVAGTAGILHQDFYLWQSTPAYYDSLNSQGRPSISPLKFGVLSLDADGNLDVSSSRIERLVFTAGLPERSTEGKADGLMVGIMKTDVLVDSAEKLVQQGPTGSGIPDNLATSGPVTNILAAKSQENPADDDADLSIRLLSTTPGKVSPIAEVAAVSSEPSVRDTPANNPFGSNPADAVLSPFEGTGTSWYSAWPSLTAQQTSGLLDNNVSLVLAAGSVVLAMTAAWFIVRAPKGPQPTIAGFGNIAPTADISGPFTSSDAMEASRRLVMVHESLRREMAGYLHGHVQSKLVAISLSLGTCRSMLSNEPDQASLVLEQVQIELQKVQDEDIRRVSHELYPAIVKMGLVPAMRSLAGRFDETLATDLIIDADLFAQDLNRDAQLPEKQTLGVYRIAEEALNNVLKHAQATHVAVNLNRNERGELVLLVTDDGCGFDAEDQAGSPGLAMMSDYARAIGGRTEIISSSGKGTAVSLVLSIEPAQLLC